MKGELKGVCCVVVYNSLCLLNRGRENSMRENSMRENLMEGNRRMRASYADS